MALSLKHHVPQWLIFYLANWCKLFDTPPWQLVHLGFSRTKTRECCQKPIYTLCDNVVHLKNHCKLNSLQLYLLDHLFYEQNCSCKFGEVCSVLERYKDYKSEKLISTVLIQNPWILFSSWWSIKKLSQVFEGKVHFWTESRLRGGRQMEGLWWWRRGSSGCLLRLVLFNVFIHNLQKGEYTKSPGVWIFLTASGQWNAMTMSCRISQNWTKGTLLA